MKKIVMCKVEKFEKAETIEAMRLNDDNWTLISNADGERIEDILFKTGTEDFEELVELIKEEEPTLSGKTFEEG